MELFLNRISTEDDLEPGDHIYTWRNFYSYSHHGIYMGAGRVIHLTRVRESNGPSTSPFQPSPGPVESCTLQEFLSGGGLYRFAYGVNVLLFLLERPGTSSRASSNPPEAVLELASTLCDNRNDFGNYDLSNNNCEDFAFYCKTGFLDLKELGRTGKSGQMDLLVVLISAAAILAFIIVPYELLPTSYINAAGMSCYIFCNSRLHFDVTSNRFEKVPIEKLRQFGHPDTPWEGKGIGIKRNLMAVILALIIGWYWTPVNTSDQSLRAIVLFVLFSIPVIDYLRDQHSKIFYYLLKHILAIILWYWIPESDVLRHTRMFCLLAVFIVLVINPLITGPPSELWQYVVVTICLVNCWCWPPKSTILQWLGLSFLNICFCIFVVDLRGDDIFEINGYIFKNILALMVLYWTPEITLLQHIRTFCLHGFFIDLVINPLMNRHSKLLLYMVVTVCLFNCWRWNQESTILQWFGLFILDVGFCKLVSCVGNHSFEMYQDTIKNIIILARKCCFQIMHYLEEFPKLIDKYWLFMFPLLTITYLYHNNYLGYLWFT